MAAGTNNAAITAMAALGACNTLSASTFIDINEITTVAAVSSLSPFMTGPASIASGPSDASLLSAGFTTANQLANDNTGSAPRSQSAARNHDPIAEINKLADAIAACTNSAGGVAGDITSCGQLFSATTLTGSSAPRDVISSLINVANHPTLNTSTLFNLNLPASPFQPQLTTAPPDFNIRPLNSGMPGGPTPSITLSPTSLSFVQQGEPIPVTVTNFGLGSVNITPINLGAGWSETDNCGTILYGQSACTINVQSTNATLGTFTGTMSIVDSDTADAQTVQLTTMNVTPVGTFDLGNWPVGSTEIGQAFSLNYSVPRYFYPTFLAGDLTDFSLYGYCTGCEFFVPFNPQTTGAHSVLINTPGGPYLAKGTGLPPGPYFSPIPSALNFSSIYLGASNSGTINLTNDGTTNETFLQPIISGPNAADFSTNWSSVSQCVSALPTQSGSFVGYQLTPSREYSCQLTVTFAPSAVGTRTATMTVSDTTGRRRPWVSERMPRSIGVGFRVKQEGGFGIFVRSALDRLVLRSRLKGCSTSDLAF